MRLRLRSMSSSVSSCVFALLRCRRCRCRKGRGQPRGGASHARRALPVVRPVGREAREKAQWRGQRAWSWKTGGSQTHPRTLGSHTGAQAAKSLHLITILSSICGRGDERSSRREARGQRREVVSSDGEGGGGRLANLHPHRVTMHPATPATVQSCTCDMNGIHLITSVSPS